MRRRAITGSSTVEIIDTSDYFSIEALEDNFTVEFSNSILEYKIDNKAWKDLDGVTLPINTGQVFKFRKKADAEVSKGEPIGRFSMGQCNIKGNIMSLLFNNDFEDKTDLSEYERVFSGLFSYSLIVNAENLRLSALILSRSCYYGMFQGSSMLVSPPELPATVLAAECYSNMFEDCGELTYAPQLKALYLEEACYYGMFKNTGLNSAPDLPATVLAPFCYYEMFYNCAYLTAAMPILPATTLDECCYSSMFYDCVELLEAPELPALTLADYCYELMFNNCNKLNYIKMLAVDILAEGCLENWVSSVSEYGVFIKHEEVIDLEEGDSGIPYNWIVYSEGENFGIKEKYLTVEALEDGLKISFSSSIEYCREETDKWYTLTSVNSLTLNKGNIVSFKNTKSPTQTGGVGYFTFKNANCAIKGNIMSLIFGDDGYKKISLEGKNYAFLNLFKSQTNIKSASELLLPARILSKNCYDKMFTSCKNLEDAPELPATTVGYQCYYSMFSGCTSLTTAPELPATTLEESCYASMFYGCTSLIDAPELPATIIANKCYQSMFEGCSSLLNAPTVLTAKTLKEYCYSYMFKKCTSLQKAPELPALLSASYCYYGMFSYCEKLNYIKALMTNASKAGALSSWVYNVAPEGIFVKHKNGSFPEGANGIPTGWAVYNDGEEIIQNIQFYCRAMELHPVLGTVLVDNTFTFVAKKGITWSEADGLYDTSGNAYISVFTMPNGTTLLSLNVNSSYGGDTESPDPGGPSGPFAMTRAAESYIAYAPETTISINSVIEANATYNFIY